MSLGQFLKRKLWVDDSLTYEEGHMSCPEMKFDGINQDLYNKLLAAAAGQGVEFNGTVAKFKDIEFSWLYDASSQTVRISPTKKPWEFTCGAIESRISGLINQARKSDI